MTLPGIFLALEMSGKYDDELARRLQRRETDAMTTLYDRFGRLAYSVILAIVRDAATAEDLVQETFLRVWNRAQAFEPARGSLGPWLLAVARNCALDHVRSSAARASRSAAEPELCEHPALFLDMARDLLSDRHSRIVRDALEKLTDQQRKAIELAYYEGLAQSEIASRLNLSPDTVRASLRAALAQVRDELTRAVAA